MPLHNRIYIVAILAMLSILLVPQRAAHRYTGTGLRLKAFATRARSAPGFGG
jgi:hypothetical protein